MATTFPPAEAAALSLSGRVAIVTGASRGIGRAIAAHLASLGATVAICHAYNSGPAESLAAELPSAVAVKSNVSKEAGVRYLFDVAESALGGGAAHILVACGGLAVTTYPTLAETSIAEFDDAFAVNTHGAFLCFREAANRLDRGGGGRIVAVSPTLQPGRASYPLYAASNAAVEAMVQTVAKELKGTRVTANCVAPGPVATDMFSAGKNEEWVRRTVGANPTGRLGDYGDIAAMVGFLCTDAAEWVNGQVIRVNGGIA